MYLADDLKYLPLYQLRRDLLFMRLDASGVKATSDILAHTYDANNEPCKIFVDYEDCEEGIEDQQDRMKRSQKSTGDAKGLLVAYVVD